VVVPWSLLSGMGFSLFGVSIRALGALLDRRSHCGYYRLDGLVEIEIC
jgi:hypothetical protein